MFIFFFCLINSQFHSFKVGLLCHSYLSFGFLCLRNVPCFFSMPVIFLRPGQTLAALDATACNIFGHNMLHTFGLHVAICCNMFDHVVSNLKTARFFVQYCGCWCCARLATFIQLCRTRAWVLGPVVACQGPGAHKHTHVATSGNDVVRCLQYYSHLESFMQELFALDVRALRLSTFLKSKSSFFQIFLPTEASLLSNFWPSSPTSILFGLLARFVLAF